MTKLSLSIEQDECTSCGLCPEYSPNHFFMGDDGVAYVKEYGLEDPATPIFCGFLGKVVVAEDQESEVIDAAEACPGSCIYVEEMVQEAAA